MDQANVDVTNAGANACGKTIDIWAIPYVHTIRKVHIRCACIETDIHNRQRFFWRRGIIYHYAYSGCSVELITLEIATTTVHRIECWYIHQIKQPNDQSIQNAHSMAHIAHPSPHPLLAIEFKTGNPRTIKGHSHMDNWYAFTVPNRRSMRG